jgi:hypothetical protein
MKIIYTSLQETDGAIRRSARQLRIDFDGSGRGETRLAQGGEGGRTGRDNSLLLSHAGSSDLCRDPAPREGREEEGERRRNLTRETSPALSDAKSVAHLLVRRFVEAQMCSRPSPEGQGRINVFV